MDVPDLVGNSQDVYMHSSYAVQGVVQAVLMLCAVELLTCILRMCSHVWLCPRGGSIHEFLNSGSVKTLTIMNLGWVCEGWGPYD